MQTQTSCALLSDGRGATDFDLLEVVDLHSGRLRRCAREVIFAMEGDFVPERWGKGPDRAGGYGGTEHDRDRCLEAVNKFLTNLFGAQKRILFG
jgi:hypothetical protein